MQIPARIVEAMGAVAACLAGAQRVVLTTHITPDGDGLGSALALCRQLRAMGKTAEVVNCSTAPNNLRFLYQKGEFSVFDPQRDEPRVRECDAIVATDLGGSARLGRMEPVVRASRATRIVIDHHLYENDLFELPLIWEEASSSAEIVYHLLDRMDATLTPALAVPLYVGLVSDTGSFCYTATTPRAHRMAAALLEAGVEPHAVWRQLSCQMPLAKMRLLGQCLSRLRLEHEGRVVWTAVDLGFLARSQLPARDAFEVVNHLLHLRGAEVGAFFMEIPGHKTKVSLRSAGRLDVCAIARRHGGGGHRFAAGCTVNGKPFQETITSVLEEIGAAFAEGNGTQSTDGPDL